MNPAPGAMLRRLLALALLAAAATASGARPVLIRTAPDDAPAAVSSGAADAADKLFCDSWMLSVETGNAGPWVSVPTRCLESVHGYIEGDRYASDSDVVALDSIAFAAQALATAQEGDAKPAWVFDIDETLLCNEPYYAADLSRMQYFNETSFNEWVDEAKAPALSSSLKLYNELLELGFHIILLTGRSEFQRNATEANLKFAGYHSWEKLILRQRSDIGKPAVQYKSER